MTEADRTHWASSFLMTGMCALIAALPPYGAWELGLSGALAALALFAAVYAGWYAATAWVLARPGSPEALRKFEERFHRPVGPGAAPAGVAAKGAVMALTVAGVLWALLSSAFAGGGWTFWTGAAAAVCGHVDAAMVRATPPHTLPGVLARVGRALFTAWLRQAREASRGSPRGTGNGGRKGEFDDVG